ncbi:hypothetical protein BC939DRAFT_459941 [Gamsiella multidivaricata]|uniref:uncharacterized protein n=1 Tax=Gamsiella multidivaricata TaxID=101098 RepID=UPI00221E88C8|nr:uncharacterized protein BC939DRAFT_459941 [Gamsiella multidivaricata]KAI7819490.1 hypothetical protein BC939DRAFT_459941 [Gamsiella multidivaricata]
MRRSFFIAWPFGLSALNSTQGHFSNSNYSMTTTSTTASATKVTEEKGKTHTKRVRGKSLSKKSHLPFGQPRTTRMREARKGGRWAGGLGNR